MSGKNNGKVCPNSEVAYKIVKNWRTLIISSRERDALCGGTVQPIRFGCRCRSAMTVFACSDYSHCAAAVQGDAAAFDYHNHKEAALEVQSWQNQLLGGQKAVGCPFGLAMPSTNPCAPRYLMASSKRPMFGSVYIKAMLFEKVC